MTQAQFIENLTELCDGKDFPKDLLKVTVYNLVLQDTGGSKKMSQFWEKLLQLQMYM